MCERHEQSSQQITRLRIHCIDSGTVNSRDSDTTHNRDSGEVPHATTMIRVQYTIVINVQYTIVINVQYTIVINVQYTIVINVRYTIVIRVPYLGRLAGQLNRENSFSLSTFAPENLVSRDGFGSPVPRQPAHLHTQTESGTYLRDSSRFPRRRPFIRLKSPYVIGSVPSLSGHASAC